MKEEVKKKSNSAKIRLFCLKIISPFLPCLCTAGCIFTGVWNILPVSGPEYDTFYQCLDRGGVLNILTVSGPGYETFYRCPDLGMKYFTGVWTGVWNILLVSRPGYETFYRCLDRAGDETFYRCPDDRGMKHFNGVRTGRGMKNFTGVQTTGVWNILPVSGLEYETFYWCLDRGMKHFTGVWTTGVWNILPVSGPRYKIFFSGPRLSTTKKNSKIQGSETFV